MRNTWLKRAKAVSMAVGNPFNGINRHDFENLSMMTRMVVNPSDGGRSVMKSMER